jgi:arylsulfatase A-like enzyme
MPPRPPFLPVIALLAAACLPAQEARRERPNVVVFYVDDQSRDMVGCYGGGAPTPRIDALARDGVRFDGYYCSSAVCSPSRYSLLTGRYASRSPRVRAAQGEPANLQWQSSLVGEGDSLPRSLRSVGYATGLVGKFHQDSDSFTPANMPAKAALRDAGVHDLLAANYAGGCEQVRSCGFSWVGGLYWTNLEFGKGHRSAELLPADARWHNPEWVTAEAVRFLDEHRSAPFFLYIAHTIPHHPNPLKSLRDGDPCATPAGPLGQPPCTTMPPRQAVLERIAAAKLPTDGSRAAAAASAVWLDDAVGAVLDHLDRLGLARDTLVVYSSDNGFPPGKFTPYEDGVRLPLLMRWPGRLPAGKAVAALASTVDLAPTLRAACGAPAPAGAAQDGVDLLPAAERGAPVRDHVFIENGFWRAVVSSEGWKYVAVRLPGKLEQRAAAKGEPASPVGKDVATYGSDKVYPGYYDRDQLYDLGADRGEQRNRAADPAVAGRLAALRQELARVSRTLPHAFGEFARQDAKGGR